MKEITEKTLIPISLMITIVLVAIWVSEVKSSADSSKADIQELKLEQRDRNKTLRSIDERLSRIEGRLGVKKDE